MELSNKDIAGIPVTDWISSSTKPAMVGWYDVRGVFFSAPGVRQWWDGERWLKHQDGPPSIFSTWPGHEWRGLARAPYAEGKYRKEKGIASALDHAGDDWKYAALNKVREFSAKPSNRGKVFAFEDVRAWAIATGLDTPPSSNAWGGIAQSAVHAGILKFTGEYRPAISPLTHGHPVKLYRVVE